MDIYSTNKEQIQEVCTTRQKYKIHTNVFPKNKIHNDMYDTSVNYYTIKKNHNCNHKMIFSSSLDNNAFHDLFENKGIYTLRSTSHSGSQIPFIQVIYRIDNYLYTFAILKCSNNNYDILDIHTYKKYITYLIEHKATSIYQYDTISCFEINKMLFNQFLKKNVLLSIKNLFTLSRLISSNKLHTFIENNNDFFLFYFKNTFQQVSHPIHGYCEIKTKYKSHIEKYGIQPYMQNTIVEADGVIYISRIRKLLFKDTILIPCCFHYGNCILQNQNSIDISLLTKSNSIVINNLFILYPNDSRIIYL